MRVRFTTSATGANYSYNDGEEVDLSDTEGAQFLKWGWVERLDTAATPTATTDARNPNGSQTTSQTAAAAGGDRVTSVPPPAQVRGKRR